MNSENIERSFNPRLAVDDYETYLKNSSKKAKLAERYLMVKKTLTMETLNLQKLDVYYKSNNKNLPIHIFIHGGYWRALDKSYHTHMAIPFVKKNLFF